MAGKLWGGRFKKRIDPAFERYSESIRTDRRLLPHDLAVGRAHVRALRRAGVLTAGELKRFLAALASIERDAKAGRFRLEGEDVHSAVHSALAKKLGPLAEKMHTGRSRNELVSQSTRLYCKEHAEGILRQIRGLQKEIVAKAEEFSDVLVPGMTHLQNAQVVSYAHILLSYAEMLDRPRGCIEGCLGFFDVCVLGSGALAGTTYRLDQKKIARDLGLSQVTRNSYDVSGDRDFVLYAVASLHFLSTALSRIAEDLLIGQMKGGIVDVDQSLCTGSSMMPQKKNADFLELARGSASIFAADFAGVSALLKGLPTSYNRDLQWDKRFLFDAVEAAEAVLPIWTTLFRTLKIRRKRAAALCADDGLYATDLADWLVGKGLPFKEAHDTVGRIVSFAEENGVAISKIGLDLLKKFSPKIDGSVYALFDAGHSVRLKKTTGSTHPAEAAKQIRFWKQQLKKV